ncbi:Galactose oxidase [Colletotrichum siamense]|uniref:Galactose oxidase n=1 Tax=Colletotrichum siamense TaxID=690259 RepID=A0A9P5F0E3_COLSI|nr:Galactose oxidase [Colletotrichum siamense]KAF4863368.1 Galactose oxidase [Colletotrichum siamense]
MGRTTLFSFLFLSLSLIQTSRAQLSSCPSAEENIVAADGSSTWAVCHQTDYQGTTTKFVDTVATLFDCAQACSQDPQCDKAVYDKANFGCHLKAKDGLTWATDARFTTIRLVSKLSNGAPIQSCPTGATNVTSSGAILAACPNTDYQGTTVRDVDGVTSIEACAIECGNDSSCLRAVFQKSSSKCYIKAEPKELQWAYQPGFDSISKVSVLADGDGITSCSGGYSNITTQNGASFATCKNADFTVPSVNIIDGCASVQACAESCTTNQDCVYAVYDMQNNVCHIKGTVAAASDWKFNRQFTSLQMVKASTSKATSKVGRWSDVIQFPIIPVAAYVVPAQPSSSRLLVFSSWGDRAFSGPTGITQFADYNFLTGAVSQRTITNTKHDMFCPGISSLASGKIVISGGENAEAVSVYDPATNEFTRAADMIIARGYQTSATLSDGRIFTIGGSFTGPIGGKTGEAYDPVQNKWTLLQGTDPTPLLTTDREGPWREDNHAWLYGWRNGSVFQAGPSKAMNWYSTNNGGSVSPGGVRTNVMDQMCGVNVMFDVGKILTAGGSQDYTDSDGTKAAHLITITDPGVPATVETLPDMNFPRGFANAIVLPDGKVIVTGGQRRSLVFTDTDSVLIPEIWDPKTRGWTQMAPATVPRNYHAVGILLPDATVFVGGGGMCPAAQGSDLSWCDRAKDHFDGEIFSPPYLFTAAGELAKRPVISSISATSVKVGSSITITLEGGLDGASFAMVRMGSATHSINSDQRRVPLTDVKKNGAGKYTVRLPNDSGVLIPGPWYLFAMSKEGVPCVARTVFVPA